MYHKSGPHDSYTIFSSVKYTRDWIIKSMIR